MNKNIDSFKTEKLNEYEKMIDSMEIFRDLIGVTIDRYKKRMSEIDGEEMYETGMIKNLTGNILVVDFGNTSNGRQSRSDISASEGTLIIRDYIYKSDVSKERLESPKFKALYRERKIVDISEEEVNRERANNSNSNNGFSSVNSSPASTVTPHHINENSIRPVRPIKPIVKVGEGMEMDGVRVNKIHQEQSTSNLIDSIIGGQGGVESGVERVEVTDDRGLAEKPKKKPRKKTSKKTTKKATKKATKRAPKKVSKKTSKRAVTKPGKKVSKRTTKKRK